jgi:hypothetical protein
VGAGQIDKHEDKDGKKQASADGKGKRITQWTEILSRETYKRSSLLFFSGCHDPISFLNLIMSSLLVSLNCHIFPVLVILVGL